MTLGASSAGPWAAAETVRVPAGEAYPRMRLRWARRGALPILRTREPRRREVLQRLWRAPRGADRTRAEPRAYTPNHLAERILRSRSALEGERKQVTVLFADVAGSMELAERVDPEDWHRAARPLLPLLADGVHRFEGTINQYTGDGVMALFGAPLAHEDHAQRACHAALAAARAAARLRRRAARASWASTSRSGSGLNSGEVVVGAIGDDLRMDYTAQGHTVGLAARMQQLAPPGGITVTEHDRALAAGLLRAGARGAQRLKGVRGPVRASSSRSGQHPHPHRGLARARLLALRRPRARGRAPRRRAARSAVRSTDSRPGDRRSRARERAASVSSSSSAPTAWRFTTPARSLTDACFPFTRSSRWPAASSASARARRPRTSGTLVEARSRERAGSIRSRSISGSTYSGSPITSRLLPDSILKRDAPASSGHFSI